MVCEEHVIALLLKDEVLEVEFPGVLNLFVGGDNGEVLNLLYDVGVPYLVHLQEPVVARKSRHYQGGE